MEWIMNKRVVLMAFFCVIQLMSGDRLIFAQNNQMEITLTVAVDELDDSVVSIEGVLSYDTEAFNDVSSREIYVLNGWGEITYNEKTHEFKIEKLDNASDSELEVIVELESVNDDIDESRVTFSNLTATTDESVTHIIEDSVFSIEVNQRDTNGLANLAVISSLIGTALLGVISATVLILVFKVPTIYSISIGIALYLVLSSGAINILNHIQTSNNDGDIGFVQDENQLVDDDGDVVLQPHNQTEQTEDEGETSDDELEGFDDSEIGEGNNDVETDEEGQYDSNPTPDSENGGTENPNPTPDGEQQEPDSKPDGEQQEPDSKPDGEQQEPDSKPDGEEQEPETPEIEVTVSTVNEEIYYEKSVKFNYEFEVDNVKPAGVKSIRVNNSDVAVSYDEQRDKYVVQLLSEASAGVYDLVVSAVTLTNKDVHSVNETYTYEVLKDEPVVSNLKVEEIENSQNVMISFDLVDADQAITDVIEMNIMNDSDIVHSENVTVGYNEFILDLEKNVVYDLTIKTTYDLDSNTLSSSDNIHSLQYDQIIEIKEDDIYKLRFNSIELLNGKLEPISSVSKNEPFFIKMDMSVEVSEIASVMMNEQSYEVHKAKDGHYYVKYTEEETLGTLEFEVSSVTLESGKTIDVLVNNQTSINVIKSIPVINEIELIEDDNHVSVTCEVSDEDGALTELIGILKDNEGLVLYEGPLTNALKIDVSDFFVETYHLEVYGDYSLSDDVHKIDQLLGMTSLNAKPKYKLVDSYVTNAIVEKEESLEIYYEFKHNDVADIASVVISNQELEAIKLSDTLYKVVYTDTASAGFAQVTLEGLKLQDLSELKITDTLEYEVKKAMPTIVEDSFEVEEKVDRNELVVRFDFYDEDESASNTTLILYDGITEVKSVEVKRGQNEITLDLTRNKPYVIEIVTDYKLTEGYKFSGSDYVLKEQDVMIVGDYELSFENLVVKNIDLETVYFNKSGTADIYFDSSNVAGFAITDIQINGEFYPVKRLENTYQVTYELPDVASVIQLNIEGVRLENQHVEPTKQLLSIEVLKDMPEISNFKVEPNEGDNFVKFSFDIVDEDRAIIEGNTFAIKSNGEIIKTQNVNVGYNELTIELKKDTPYVFEMYVGYDLDTNVLTDSDNEGSLSLVRDVFIEDDAAYNFEFFGIDFYDEQFNEISLIERETDVLLHLDLNVELSDVISVVVNDRAYDVLKFGEDYYVSLTDLDTTGIETFELTSVMLESGKLFTELQNNVASLEVVKKKPLLEDVRLTENGNRLVVNVDVLDEDNALLAINGTIKDANGNVLYDGEIVNNFELDVTRILTTQFEIELYADYILSENYEYFDVLFGQHTENANARFNLVDAYLSTTAINKLEDVELYVELESNNVAQITHFNVSKLIVEAEHVENNLYKAIINFGEIPGIHTVTLERLLLTNDEQFQLAHDLTFEILKDAPRIDDEFFVVTENEATRQVSLDFEIIDADQALINQTLQLFEGEQLVSSYPLVAGDNLITLDLKRYTEYDAKIMADYRVDFINETILLEQLLKEFTVKLVGDYALELNNLTVHNDGIETNYFEKNGLAQVYFTSTNEPDFEVTEIKINDVFYPVEKLVTYYRVLYPVQAEAGVEVLTLSEVKLENLHVETISETLNIEVLKDIPTANKTSQTVLPNGDIEIGYEVIDSDKAVTHLEIEVFDKFNNQLEHTNEDSIIFTPTSSDLYTVTIKANYDLDTDATNGLNEANEVVILNETITHTAELLELKEIEHVTLFKRYNDSFSEVDSVTIEGFVASDYIAKVKSSVFGELYLNVADLVVEDNHVYLMLDYENSVTYKEGDVLTGTKVKYGTAIDGVASSLDFDKIVQMIQEDPSQDITLTNDLDFNDLTTVGTYVFNGTYTGTFDGNGYTIRNLERSLFQYIEGTVKNLVIADANIKTSNGILAFTTQGATIDNVHIVDSIVSKLGNGLVGAFTPISRGGTTFTNSSVSNTDVIGGLRTGGFVGGSYDGLTVTNSYFDGNVTSNDNRVGGILGQSYSGHTVITNSYVSGNLVVNNQDYNSGFIGYNPTTGELSNNLSLMNGEKGYRIYGNGNYTLSNNYVDSSSTLQGHNVSGVTEISRDELNEAFFYETLEWDANVWVFHEDAKIPVLNHPIYLESENVALAPSTEGVSIPNYEVLSQLAMYDEAREIAYHNAFDLMPFYESKYIINLVNSLAIDDVLNQKIIKNIYPLDEFNSIVYGLNNTKPDEIKSLRIQFADGQKQDYELTYDKTLEGVAIYKINDLPLSYNFNKLVLDLAQSKYNEILSLAQAIDFVDDIEPLTVEVDSRLMRDWYNEQFKPNLEEIVLELIESTPLFIAYEENANQTDLIMSTLETDHYLEWLLYTVNYFDRYYNVEMGISQLSDMFVLGGQTYYSEKMSIDYLMSKIKATSYKDEREYVAFYNVDLAPLVGGSPMRSFLNDRILTLTDYENPDDWFTEEIGSKIGQFRELGMEDYPEAQYRAWTMINRRDFLVLPIISATDDVLEDLHLTTMPSQIMYSSLNRYQAHLDQDPIMDEILDDISNQWLNYLQIPANWIEDPVKYLNGKTSLHVDSRQAFPYLGMQYPETTQDPVLKWLYDEWNIWPADNGSGAYANGTDAYYVRTPIIGANKSVGTLTHEAAHNMDGFYFYQSNGRRTGTRAEDHADGNLSQWSNNLAYSFNVIEDVETTAPVFSNFKLDRIETSEQLEDLYHDGFDTLYVLDYLIGEAFVSLTPFEQSLVATQAKEIGTSTEYSRLSAAEFEAMELQSVYDLYDNKLTLLNPHTMGTNNYSQPSHVDVYWYQPFYAIGRTDGNTFKRMGFEFLGEAGYQDGYMTYMSRISANDVEALQKMTDDETMTYETYKKGRFNEAEQFITYVRENEEATTYLDLDGLSELFVNALKTYANTGNKTLLNNAKHIAYGVIKRATNDFTTGTVYEQADTFTYTISTAEQLLAAIESNDSKMGSYKIVADLDFSSIETSDIAYVMDTFVGYIEGNNHVITGLTKPLFNDMYYSYIKDLTFADIVFTESNLGVVAHTTYYSGIENLRATQLTNVSKFINYAVNSIEIGENVIETNDVVNKIYTVDEFLAMDSASSYQLMANLNFADVALSTPMINGTFTGVLDGNGFTVYNLKQPLFNELSGTVKNLNIENVVIKSTGDYLGAIAKTSENAKLYNIRGHNISVTGRHNIASIIGQPVLTTIDNVDVTNIKVTTSGVYGGGLVGRAFYTNISNVYAEGEVYLTATSNGGIVGVMRNSSTVSNIFANVDVIRTANTDNRDANSAFIGMFESGDGTARNSIVYGNGSDASDVAMGVYKTIWAADPYNNDTLFINVYEVAETTGISSITETSNISQVSINDLSKEFYLKSLGWSEDVWDFSGDVPRLHDRTDTGDVSIVHKVSTVDDFLAINQNLEARYELAADLDFTDVTVEGPLIKGDFTGEFDGYGYSIQNLTNPMFESISGTVKNVTIDSANLAGTERLGALAHSLNQATIYNIRATDVFVTGTTDVGALAGTTVASHIDNVQFINVNVTGDGEFVGGLVGQSQDSKISNVYIDGAVSLSASNSGGVIGVSKGETYLSNIVANVSMNRSGFGLFRNAVVSGGIVSQFENNSGSLTQSIALSDVSDSAFSYKVVSVDHLPSELSSVYEVSERTGQTSVTLNEGLTAVSQTQLNKDFYVNTVGLKDDVWGFTDEIPKLLERSELGSPIYPEPAVVLIQTVDDLLAINTTDGLKGRYQLAANLDLSAHTATTPIINGTFSGEFDGNGFKISNSKQPLFTALTGVVKNLGFENVVITSTGDQFGAIAKTSNGAKILNIRGNNIQVSGQHKLGALIGEPSATTIDNVDITNVSITGTGFYVGGLAGRAFGTTISNVYIDGRVFLSKTAGGGVVGVLRDTSNLVNIFGNVEVIRTSNADDRDANAGLVGQFETSNGVVSRSIAYADVTYEDDTIMDVYKVIWATDPNNNSNRFKTVYEVIEASGKTSVIDGGGITSISRAQLNKEFYVSTLKFNEDVWDFTNEIPRLKNEFDFDFVVEQVDESTDDTMSPIEREEELEISVDTDITEEDVAIQPTDTLEDEEILNPMPEVLEDDSEDVEAQNVIEQDDSNEVFEESELETKMFNYYTLNRYFSNVIFSDIKIK